MYRFVVWHLVIDKKSGKNRATTEPCETSTRETRHEPPPCGIT
jgi:hypothetical protein